MKIDFLRRGGQTLPRARKLVFTAHRRLREIGATAWPKPFPDFRDGSLQRELRQILRFSSAASAPSSNETTSTPPTLPLEIDRV